MTPISKPEHKAEILGLAITQLSHLESAKQLLRDAYPGIDEDVCLFQAVKICQAMPKSSPPKKD